MHQLTGSLLCKRCRKATKKAKDMQRNVRNPSTGLCLGLQDTKTTWDGDRATKRAKNPKCAPPELSAASQRCRMLWDNSSLDSRVRLSTCFVSERIFRCPVIFFRASRLCPSAPPAPSRPRHTNRPSRRCAPRPAGALRPRPHSRVSPSDAKSSPMSRQSGPAAASGRAEARPRRLRAG